MSEEAKCVLCNKKMTICDKCKVNEGGMLLISHEEYSSLSSRILELIKENKRLKVDVRKVKKLQEKLRSMKLVDKNICQKCGTKRKKCVVSPGYSVKVCPICDKRPYMDYERYKRLENFFKSSSKEKQKELVKS